MAVEGAPGEGPISVNVDRVDHTGKFIVIFVILGLLIIGQIYFMTRIGSLGTSLQASQNRLAKRLNGELAAQIQQLSNANAQSLEELRSSLDATTAQMSAMKKRAVAGDRQAAYLIRRVEREENERAQQLQQEIAQKADRQQVGSLTQDISSEKSGLAAANRAVSALSSNLGMARSRLGTLIARNHNEIVALQGRGQRNYYEFDLVRNQKKLVAGVTLILRKANLKRHDFNMDMIYNDMTVSRTNLVVDSPVFFAPSQGRDFYELVVYRLAAGSARGYISTPKGASREIISGTGS
jgi:hypothetical protein